MTNLEFRSFDVREAPEDSGGGVGVFRGYASTWDRDLYDDVIVKGAFAQTLSADYPNGGAGIPIHWEHRDGSPNDIIGETLSAVEDDHGLLITAKLDTDIPEGKRAYDLLQRGLIHQMSIGFVPEKTAWVESEDAKGPFDGHREIQQIKLFEISLVQIAANQGAEVLEVKSGRAISDANRSKIQGVVDALTALLEDSAPPSTNDEPDDADKPDAEPDGTASDDTTDDDATDDAEDGKTPAGKGFDPNQVREIKGISDFLSLANNNKEDSVNIMDQLAAEKKAAQALIDKGVDNLTGDEFANLKHHYEEAKTLQERIDLLKGVNDLNVRKEDAVNTKSAEIRSLGDLYAHELKKAGLTVEQTKSGGFVTSEFKANTDTHVAGTGRTTDTGYQPVVTQIDMNGVWPYERPLVVADLFGSITLTGSNNTVEYPIYSALDGAPGMVAEGGEKPQVHLPEPTWTSDSLKEVAALWKISDNMAEDLGYVVSEINNHARYNLQLLEETQLLFGDGTGQNIKGLLNRDGVQAMAQAADSDPDRIFKARTKIALATGFRADALVINPADYEAIRLSKDANGQYYGGGYFNGQYGNGAIMQDPPLWGLKTVVTEAITAGTALVGAFKLGGSVIRKGGLRAESTNSHDTDFAHDLISFRIRERIGLQVKYPQAFVKVSLGKAGK